MSTICISIHAPTRGATLFVAVKVWYPIFQSTLPREERLCAGFSLYLCTDFNPRSHERSDKKSVDDGDMMSISIHAPTRGATLSGSVQLKTDFKFQSTLPREERHNDMEYMRDMDKFQSTLPREERPATLQSGT